MKYLIILLLLISCGQGNDTTTVSEPRTRIVSCTVTENDSNAIISCPDGTQVVIKSGADGVNGTNGIDGVNGTNGTNGVDGVDGIAGVNGKDGVDGATGPQGPQGVQGIQGEPGLPGERGVAGRDGTDGINGQDGEPGLPGAPGTIITPVIPCPTRSGAFPEVLLCIDNTLYAVFVGSQTRYAAIPAGSYQTTDGRYCNFHVEATCLLSY